MTYLGMKISPDGLMTITVSCCSCKKQHTVTVPDEGYYRWRNGKLIQEAMPELSPVDREKLQTGMCEHCQSSFFEAAMEE